MFVNTSALRKTTLYSDIFDSEEQCLNNPFLFTDDGALQSVKPLAANYSDPRKIGPLLISVDANGD